MEIYHCILAKLEQFKSANNDKNKGRKFYNFNLNYINFFHLSN